VKTEKSTLPRRHFLLAAGAAAAAGVAATSRQAAGDAAPTPKRTAAPAGYRVTEHVRNYYRTTRI